MPQTRTIRRSRNWRRRLTSEGFRHQASHFQQCVGNFDRVAGYVARCRDAADGALGRLSEKINRYQRGEIAQPPDPVYDPDRLTLNEASLDFPLFLAPCCFTFRSKLTLTLTWCSIFTSLLRLE